MDPEKGMMFYSSPLPKVYFQVPCQFLGGEDNLTLLKKRCFEDFECLGQLTRVFYGFLIKSSPK